MGLCLCILVIIVLDMTDFFCGFYFSFKFLLLQRIIFWIIFNTEYDFTPKNKGFTPNNPKNDLK